MADVRARARARRSQASACRRVAICLAEAPLAARFILRGGEAVRVACGKPFGAEPPSGMGLAGGVGGRGVSGSGRTNGC